MLEGLAKFWKHTHALTNTLYRSLALQDIPIGDSEPMAGDVERIDRELSDHDARLRTQELASVRHEELCTGRHKAIEGKFDLQRDAFKAMTDEVIKSRSLHLRNFRILFITVLLFFATFLGKDSYWGQIAGTLLGLIK